MKTDVIIGIVFCIFATCVTVRKKALTWPAVIAANIMIGIICLASSWVEAAFLLGMYMSVFGVDILIHRHNKEKKKGTCRGLIQILANGSTAIVLILGSYFANSRVLQLAYYTAIFEVLADSIASDVGVISRKPPRDICSGKIIESGMSGGVSALGLLSSLAACAAAGCIAGVVLGANPSEIIGLILIPYCGMLLDSILGSAFQVKYQCVKCGSVTEKREHCKSPVRYFRGIPYMNNSMVNFLCTIFTGIGSCCYFSIL